MTFIAAALMSDSSLHVCIILGTRPEAIKLAPVIRVFQQDPDMRTQVVLTGQHREMVDQVMALFQLTADATWPSCSPSRP
jgi:UDP-N-acetylglucosamine 2-epimerase (non-hydrolysing)